MFTSYAQNFEDVILWRALRNVPNGFYIDIGAQHPVTHSVSRGFYEKGWRGLSVEPMPLYAEMLRNNRPDETVIQAAVGEATDAIKFYSFPETGLSTASAEIAEQHCQSGFNCKEIEVETISLSSIFDKFKDSAIHWLKIDVEGMEASVIKSWEGSSSRPWIVVVEATQPLSQILSHDLWESIVVGYGYTFAYFDGLNRFYVSSEHDELLVHFGPGANVFDDFKLADNSPYIDTTARDQAEISAKGLANKIELQENELTELKEQLLVCVNTATNLTDVFNEREDRIAELVKERDERNANHVNEKACLLEEFSRLQDEIWANEQNAKQQIQSLEARNQLLTEQIAYQSQLLLEANMVVAHEQSARRSAEASMSALYSSNSWKLTTPLRAMTRSLYWLKRR